MAEARKIGESAGTGNRGKGRKKGVPNKTTAVIKEAIAAVYSDLQAQHEGEGEHSHFLNWAKDTPTEFYKLASKLLPLQLTGEGGGPLQHEEIRRTIVRPGD